MRVDLNKEILTLDDKPFQTGETQTVAKVDDKGEPVLDDNGKPIMVTEPVHMTARFLLVSAYANIVQKQGVNLTEKVARGAMAMRLHKAKGFIEFSAEEVVKAKELLGEIVPSPIVMMRIVEILDPSSVPQEGLAAVPDALPE
jgi:hypothetical protein